MAAEDARLAEQRARRGAGRDRAGLRAARRGRRGAAAPSGCGRRCWRCARPRCCRWRSTPRDLLLRVERAVAMLQRAQDERVVRLHPEDLALIGARLPASLTVEARPERRTRRPAHRDRRWRRRGRPEPLAARAGRSVPPMLSTFDALRRRACSRPVRADPAPVRPGHRLRWRADRGQRAVGPGRRALLASTTARAARWRPRRSASATAGR